MDFFIQRCWILDCFVVVSVEVQASEAVCEKSERRGGQGRVLGSMQEACRKSCQFGSCDSVGLLAARRGDRELPLGCGGQ